MAYEPNAQFHAAASYVTNAPQLKKVSNDVRLELYALYKYVTVGPKPPTSRPSIFDMTGRAKWDAWSSLADKHGFTAPAQAEARYLGLCEELGWVPDVAPVYIAQPEEPGEGDIDWDAPDDLSARLVGAGGMANAVSVLQQEEEESPDLNTLHGVVLAGDLEQLKAMEEQEIDLNALDEYGFTPLHLAADRGHVELVRELLRVGADRGVRDSEGLTALELAEAAGQDEVVQLLREGE